MKDYFMTETQQNSWCNGLTPTKIQIARWFWHKDNILNPIREHVGIPVHVSDGIRNDEITQYYLKQGWNPSLKSDHFGGLPTILTNQKHIIQFEGKIYWLSTFATDIDGDFDHRRLCKAIRLTVLNLIPKGHEMYVHGISKYGVEQLILESQMKDEKLRTWIHVASPLEAFFSESQSKIIRKMRNNLRFMEYKNGQYQKSKFD